MRKIKWEQGYRAILSSYALEESEIIGLHVREYDSGDMLCCEGTPLTELLIVISGRSRVSCMAENGRSLLLCFSEGESIHGDLELFTGRELACSDVQAATKLRALAIPMEDNRELLLKNAAFLARAGGDLAAKLERSTQNCAAIILNSLGTRLCRYIELTARNGVFAERLGETAELLGTSYRHLMRELGRLCESGILEHSGPGEYKISDIKRLSEKGAR